MRAPPDVSLLVPPPRELQRDTRDKAIILRRLLDTHLRPHEQRDLDRVIVALGLSWDAVAMTLSVWRRLSSELARAARDP